MPHVPTLLLLNGPPGVGKSTLAERWADSTMRRYCIDPDRLRAAMADADTLAAMHAARREACVMSAAQGAGDPTTAWRRGI